MRVTRFAILTICGVIASLMLSGCGPSTWEDCRLEASKAPTELGVKVAAFACDEKFQRK